MTDSSFLDDHIKIISVDVRHRDRVAPVAATSYPCWCRGRDAADPCGHGDTSEGCPRHDPNPDTRAEYDEENGRG